ncbi:MAG: type II toxin-antitoxin system VapC family toxin [Actinomycetota bacterium]|nr:type II toxin-antitoxin system VapC family toxin [Actinomycetota bacterium]
MPSAEPILLDTHAVLWWQAESDRLPTSARERIATAGTVLVSSISCWEIAMLVGKQRVRLDRPTAAWVCDLLATDGVDLAALTPRIAVTAAELHGFHGDPADRFLYATAQELNVPLLSKDRRLRDYAEPDRTVSVLW